MSAECLFFANRSPKSGLHEAQPDRLLPVLGFAAAEEAPAKILYEFNLTLTRG